MIIEKSPDRLIARGETVSWPSGLVLILFLALWLAVGGKELPKAWADRSWAHAARPLGGMAVGTLLFGGIALFAMGHQRLTLSPEGLENAWVVVRPIRCRFVPFADITSIDVVTVSGEESNSTYLSVRTARHHVKWTLFGDDPSLLRAEIRSSFRAMRRKDG
jgi:hypothetical protein